MEDVSFYLRITRSGHFQKVQELTRDLHFSDIFTECQAAIFFNEKDEVISEFIHPEADKTLVEVLKEYVFEMKVNYRSLNSFEGVVPKRSFH